MIQLPFSVLKWIPRFRWDSSVYRFRPLAVTIEPANPLEWKAFSLHDRMKETRFGRVLRDEARLRLRLPSMLIVKNPSRGPLAMKNSIRFRIVPGIIRKVVLLASIFAYVQNRSVADEVPVAAVEGQPLAANVQRVIEALDYLGHPLPADLTAQLLEAGRHRDSGAMQALIDRHVLLVVSLNPEVRVKVARGPAEPRLQQAGYTPHLVKVLNDSTVTRQMRVFSPQAGPVYSGAADAILKRQAQTELGKNANVQGATDRFFELEMFQQQPMTRQLSGLAVEYAIVLLYTSEAGHREATIGFDVGAGTQDLGFRGEVPVLFDCRSAENVKLRIRDFDGRPTTARMTFRDELGHVYPPQVKRLAPDFFFQPQIYRQDGASVLLPPGTFELTSNRGPEYRDQVQTVTVQSNVENVVEVQLDRWVNPRDFGFYSGDHHIHGAGCAHYDNPTQGVTPQDMFAQVKGEGLNVGCVLTWGPCFDFQRGYFSPIADTVSEPLIVLKYDLEISGFGSAALGHVCLLDLDNQTYPGSEGTKIKGWPTWTVPVMRWAKEQGGVTGYPHSALHVNPQGLSQRLLKALDRDGSGALDAIECQDGLLPDTFAAIDENGYGSLDQRELEMAAERAANTLPNVCIPEMNGAGAMEIFVSTAEGVCDFISAMDTERIPELNTWYHLLNCGFPLKLSGETDFPCMSSRRVGQGRVYVQLGKRDAVNFSDWCQGLMRGQSYVSDGFAHALEFSVDGITPGTEDVQLSEPGPVTVSALVSFAREQPRSVAQGGIIPSGGRRVMGDTRLLHAPRDTGTQSGGVRRVEVIVNGEVVDSFDIAADNEVHAIRTQIDVQDSAWVALRQFPQLHTNPVNVVVGGRTIRASADSARWCAESTRTLWDNRHHLIAEHEREAAKAAYDRANEKFRLIETQARSRAAQFSAQTGSGSD